LESLHVEEQETAVDSDSIGYELEKRERKILVPWLKKNPDEGFLRKQFQQYSGRCYSMHSQLMRQES